MAKQRVSFYTFGCRLNQSETAVIQNGLESRGYSIVNFGQESDIVVVNTCTVTEGGDADTRRLVHKVNRLHPKARIALVGCQAQVQKEALTHLPNVRWVVGNQRKMELADVLEEFPALHEPAVVTPTIERTPFVQREPSLDRDHTRATIKIQDGCDFFCSFCEIPYARGRARSRVFDDIIREAHDLAGLGRKEIVLTGINIGTYAYEGKGIVDIVRALEAIEPLKRIRISSIEPTTVPKELLGLMGHKLCRYLHMPLQSGHDDILTAMKRQYSIKDYAGFIVEAKAHVPHVCIGTDIIVGFPGETDKHFEQTLEKVRDWPIDYVHVFSYSPRQMAKSGTMNHAVPSAVISRRSQALRELSTRKRRLFYQTLMGSTQDVLLESFKDGYWIGLTDHYVRVKIRLSGYHKNEFMKVRLTSIEGLSVVGEP